MKRIHSMTRGLTSPAGHTGVDALYDLPPQMLPSTRENIVVNRITVLESLRDESHMHRNNLGQSPRLDYRETVVDSGRRPPECEWLSIDHSGITVVPTKHSPGTIVMAREIFRRQFDFTG